MVKTRFRIILKTLVLIVILRGCFRLARATTKRFTPELRAGIGGAGLRFSPDQQTCVNGPARQNVSQFSVGFGYGIGREQ
jgi:hypothetical protein